MKSELIQLETFTAIDARKDPIVALLQEMRRIACGWECHIKPSYSMTTQLVKMLTLSFQGKDETNEDYMEQHFNGLWQAIIIIEQDKEGPFGKPGTPHHLGQRARREARSAAAAKRRRSCRDESQFHAQRGGDNTRHKYHLNSQPPCRA